MIVRFTRRAQGDLTKILNYLDERSPRGAQRQACHYPSIGHPTAQRAIRGMPVGRYPYLVFWTVEAGEIWVLHIRHGTRRVWRG